MSHSNSFLIRRSPSNTFSTFQVRCNYHVCMCEYACAIFRMESVNKQTNKQIKQIKQTKTKPNHLQKLMSLNIQCITNRFILNDNRLSESSFRTMQNTNKTTHE